MMQATQEATGKHNKKRLRYKTTEYGRTDWRFGMPICASLWTVYRNMYIKGCKAHEHKPITTTTMGTLNFDRL